MALPICKHCAYYEPDILQRTGESFGICHNKALSTKIIVDGKNLTEEDAVKYFEEYMGCILFREGKTQLTYLPLDI